MNIRKISVGPDYKNSAMHYVLGQSVLGGSYIIHMIQFDSLSLKYKIWIENDGEILLWKEFSNSMPVSIEHNIDF